MRVVDFPGGGGQRLWVRSVKVGRGRVLCVHERYGEFGAGCVERWRTGRAGRGGEGEVARGEWGGRERTRFALAEEKELEGGLVSLVCGSVVLEPLVNFVADTLRFVFASEPFVAFCGGLARGRGKSGGQGVVWIGRVASGLHKRHERGKDGEGGGGGREGRGGGGGNGRWADGGRREQRPSDRIQFNSLYPLTYCHRPLSPSSSSSTTASMELFTRSHSPIGLSTRHFKPPSLRC